MVRSAGPPIPESGGTGTGTATNGDPLSISFLWIAIGIGVVSAVFLAILCYFIAMKISEHADKKKNKKNQRSSRKSTGVVLFTDDETTALLAKQSAGKATQKKSKKQKLYPTPDDTLASPAQNPVAAPSGDSRDSMRLGASAVTDHSASDNTQQDAANDHHNDNSQSNGHLSGSETSVVSGKLFENDAFATRSLERTRDGSVMLGTSGRKSRDKQARRSRSAGSFQYPSDFSGYENADQQV